MSDPYYASSASVEWYTPAYLVDAVIRVMGAVDCDPCSNPEPFNVPAAVHYTQADDGLAHPWRGRVYVNPPYGDNIGDWITKLLTERALGRLTTGILLVPGSFDTRWFQPLWTAGAICFMRGRVAFVKQQPAGGGNTKNSVMVYWGGDVARFASVFAEYGQIVYPDAPPRVAHQLPLLEVA